MQNLKPYDDTQVYGALRTLAILSSRVGSPRVRSFLEQEGQTLRDLSRSTLDELAGRYHFYVTVKDGPRVGWLMGPFRQHIDALLHVDLAKKRARQDDPYSTFYYFGTAALEASDPIQTLYGMGDVEVPAKVNPRLETPVRQAPAGAMVMEYLLPVRSFSLRSATDWANARDAEWGGLRREGDYIVLPQGERSEYAARNAVLVDLGNGIRARYAVPRANPAELDDEDEDWRDRARRERETLARYGLHNVGLNADWAVSAYMLSPGRPNLTDGAHYLVDNEDGSWSLVRRWYLDNDYQGMPDEYRAEADGNNDAIVVLANFNTFADVTKFLEEWRTGARRLNPAPAAILGAARAAGVALRHPVVRSVATAAGMAALEHGTGLARRALAARMRRNPDGGPPSAGLDYGAGGWRLTHEGDVYRLGDVPAARAKALADGIMGDSDEARDLRAMYRVNVADALGELANRAGYPSLALWMGSQRDVLQTALYAFTGAGADLPTVGSKWTINVRNRPIVVTFVGLRGKGGPVIDYTSLDGTNPGYCVAEAWPRLQPVPMAETPETSAEVADAAPAHAGAARAAVPRPSVQAPKRSDAELKTGTARGRANIEALKVLRWAQDEREATGTLPELSADELSVLSRYSGWGGVDPREIPEADRAYLAPAAQAWLRIDKIRIDEKARGVPAARRTRIPGEIRDAWEGTIAQYFTPRNVCDAMLRWAVQAFDTINQGKRPLDILEPSAGVGRFLQGWFDGAVPNGGEARWQAVELDSDLADMLRLLYGQPHGVKVFQGALEDFYNAQPRQQYDLVIANPPYAGRGDERTKDGGKWGDAHHYFMWRNLQQLRPRGVMVQLVPWGVITGTDPGSRAIREELLKLGHFLGAVLPPGKGLFPGAMLSLTICLFARRPRTLAKVLDEDREILEGRFFEGANARYVMGVPQGGHYRPEVLVGTFDPALMLTQPLRPPPDSFFEIVPHDTPTFDDVELEVPQPTSVGNKAGAVADYYDIGQSLGYRVSRLRIARENDPDLARRMQIELRGDLEAYARHFGNPRERKVKTASGAWAALLSVFDDKGGLTGIMAGTIAAPPHVYKGERNGPAAVKFLSARQGFAHLDDVREALEGLPVDALELALHPEVYVHGHDGDLLYLRGNEYLTGEVWPKIDWLDAQIASGFSFQWPDRPDTPSTAPVWSELVEKLRRQRQALLTAAGRVPLAKVYFGVRSQWVHHRPNPLKFECPLLLEWMAQTFKAKLERVWCEGGVLLVEGKDRFNPAVQNVLAYFNREEKKIDGEGKMSRRQKAKALDKRIAADKALDESFKQFVLASEQAGEVEERYNRDYRSFVPRSYDNSPIRLARLPDPGDVRPHIWAAVRRQLERRGGIMALDVGLGKTVAAMLTAAALREEGAARKIMFVVPNSVGPNWLAEIARFLPDYRVVPIGFTVKYDENDKATSTPDDVKTITKKLQEYASDCYDCAVVQHSTLMSFGFTKDRLKALFREHFGANRDVKLEKENARRDQRRILLLEQELANKDPSTKAYQNLKDQIDRLKVTPWLERLQKQLAQTYDEGERERIQKQIDKFAAMTAPSVRAQATDEQDLEEWIEERLGRHSEDGELLGPKVDGITFDELGVDLLVVDEAHQFKNLYGAATRYGKKLKYMGAMSDEAVVGKCWDLWAKAKYVRETHADTGVILLTATPLKNSPIEAYNLLSYCTDRTWDNRGITGPEDFIDRYCQGESEPVLLVDGSFREDLAVRQFTNLDELRTIFDQWVDVKVAVPEEDFARLVETGADVRNTVPLVLPVGEGEDFYVPMSPGQQAVYEEIRKNTAKATESAVKTLCKLEGDKLAEQSSLDAVLADAAAEADDDDDGEDEGGGDEGGGGKKKDKNKGAEILKMMDQMSKAALDLALLKKDDGEDPPKYVKLAAEIKARPGCAHIVFSDYNETHGRIRDAIARLAGIDKRRIRSVTGALSPGERQDVANRFNGKWDKATGTWIKEPEFDVLIGNTATMGEGMNLQARTCAIHHLTLPWEPASVQQRNGRGVRQGNRFKVVALLYYLADRSFDGYRLGLIKGKRDWMRGLLESADKVTNNPGAELVGPCAMLKALAADQQAAEAACECLENAAAQKARNVKRGQAYRDFAALVSHLDAARRTPERADYHNAQARTLAALLRELPDDVFDRKDLIEIAERVPVFIDGARGIPWIEGSTVCVQSQSFVIEKIDLKKSQAILRPLGRWQGVIKNFGELAAMQPAATCDWNEEKDREVRARQSFFDLGRLKEVDPALGTRDYGILLEALKLPKHGGAPGAWMTDADHFLLLPFERANAEGTELRIMAARRMGPEDRLLLPWLAEDAERFVQLVRALPKQERVLRKAALQRTYEGYFVRSDGTGLPRTYPKDLREETLAG